MSSIEPLSENWSKIQFNLRKKQKKAQKLGILIGLIDNCFVLC